MAQITISWDPNPAEEQVTGYKVYVDALPAVDVAAPTLTTELEPGAHTIQISAVNLWGEGPKSDPVQTPVAPTKPGHIVISVTVSVIVNP